MMKRKMNPSDIFELMEEDKFPLFTRGDIVLTNNHESFLSRLIRLRGKIAGEEHLCSHVELYMMSGHSIGADRKVDLRPLRRFFRGKHDVYVMHHKKLDDCQRDSIVSESLRSLKRPYDYTGLLWQALDGITHTSIFSKLFNRDVFVYCSEFVERVYKKAVNKKVSMKKIGTSTPGDIMLYTVPHKDWACMFSMVKRGKEWDIVM